MNDEQFEQLARGILVAALAGVGSTACGSAETPPSAPTAKPSSVVVIGAEAEAPPALPGTSSVASTPAPRASAQAPLGPEKLPEGTPQGERCGDDDQINLVAQLTPTPPVDFISLRQFVHHREGAVTPVATIGAVCSGAQDQAACSRTVAATQPLEGFRTGCIPGHCAFNLLYTRGNSVGMADNVEQLTELLAPIDTEGEAYLLAWSQQYSVASCSQLPSSLKKTTGGYLLTATKMTNSCPIEITQFNLKINTSGSIQVLGSKLLSKNGPCAGRRPAGFTLAAASRHERAGGGDGSGGGDGNVGTYLALSAQLEDASVAAFERMSWELRALGAPHSLLRDAQRAAADERRHTDAMTRHALRYHAVPLRAQVPAAAPRSAFAVALENAVEGCVRETYGALVGLHQAAAARDVELRHAMAEIAQDELRHAALSWRVAAWLAPQLSADERSAIAGAKRRAVAELLAGCDAEPAPDLLALAGLPPREVARSLAAQLQSALWAEAAA